MNKPVVILGISCFYHDSAAALIVDGVVVAAAQEERFSRTKHDSTYPSRAVSFCLEHAGLTVADITYVAFYEKPLLKFERLLETYIGTWPWGLISFVKAMLSWSGSKLWADHIIRRELGYEGEILWVEHHYAHAASSYYCSPYERAAIVVVDGVGERDTTTIGYARGNSIRLTHTISFPHSLGLLYSACTYYLGFTVNSDEYKVMGLAPYGNPSVYGDAFEKLVDWKPDGSYELRMEYFAYEYGSRMITKKFEELFGGAPRVPESPLTERDKDIAAALQCFIEAAMLRIAAEAGAKSGEHSLCLSGGVVLNCVANGVIAASGLFDRVYVPPAPGDAGGSVGAALYVYYDMLEHPKSESAMRDAYAGPEYSVDEIRTCIEHDASGLANGRSFSVQELPDDTLFDTVAGLLEGESAVGWFQGRMEFGPRALGNRSILADPRNHENWQRINMKIKFRESFRPLAPSVLEENADEYFNLMKGTGEYMMTAVPVRSTSIPAVTHVNGTARVHTVNPHTNPRYDALLRAFYKRTGCPVLVNTSFNVRGEPIVMTPRDALRCFFATDMDYLVMGNHLLSKGATIEQI